LYAVARSIRRSRSQTRYKHSPLTTKANSPGNYSGTIWKWSGRSSSPRSEARPQSRTVPGRAAAFPGQRPPPTP
jgi:hypothetical protein